MTAQEILEEIKMLGGRLEARGDRLRVDVPAGALTPELKAALAEHKTEVLAVLTGDLNRDEWRTEPLVRQIHGFKKTFGGTLGQQ